MFQWDASSFATHAYSTFFILYNFAIFPYECSVFCEHMEKSVVAWNEKKIWSVSLEHFIEENLLFMKIGG